MVKNEWCLKCISFLLRDEYGVPNCHGVEPHTAETEGCMHCYNPTTGSKVGDEIFIVKADICGTDGRIKDALFRKKELDIKLRGLRQQQRRSKLCRRKSSVGGK